MDVEFAAGSRVRARGLEWDVLEVELLGAQTLLRLRCVGGDLDGLRWNILHPAELVQPLRADLCPDRPGPFTAWLLHHQACLLQQVLGPSDLLIAEPGRVHIEPYQLVPLMRALELPRARLLLADGVGLGKTIEAGLIICELIARRRAHRVLVISPAGPLLVQWQQEMRYRFGLRFAAITDAAALQLQRRKLELGGNPFDAIALCLVSLDFAKQERVLEELERSAWDLAVIDEAHHCISCVGHEETQRRRLAEVIARRSDGLLLLTATPHDGHDSHFASLIELLDPSLVDGRGGIAGSAYRRHVVRRLKSHIRDSATGAPLFRQRRVIPARVEVMAAEARRFHQALAALIAPRLRRASVNRGDADALAFVGLLKRSVSTISACVNTLRVVAERYAAVLEPDADVLRRERARALRVWRKRLLRFGVLEAADESDLAAMEVEGMAADLQGHAPEELASATGTVATSAALQALIWLGEAAEQYDPKLIAIVQEVRAIRRQSPGANVLIYTEYADSQLAALGALCGAVDGEVLAINGLDDEQTRSRIAERFSEQDTMVLISTDSLAEGLNLQRRCCHLMHLDLPYNPNRLEQRNGRIDRYGQEREAEIRYFYLGGTFEERVLLRLIAKYEKARAQLDFMPDTLGVTADQAECSARLVAGFAERQAKLFDDAPSSLRTLDRAAEQVNADGYRGLLREIDRAFDSFDRSAVRYGWLAAQGLNAGPALLADAVQTGYHNEAPFGQIDLVDFVAAAVEMETGRATKGSELPLPADWCIGLDDLPGFDRARSVLRVTRNRAVARDARGRTLAFLGRAHPVVRRACATAHRSNGERCDHRVSVAASADRQMAVLLTFQAEIRTTSQTEYRRVIAILLPRDGPAAVISEPQQWLRLGARPDPSLGKVWRELFSSWVPARRREAETLAVAVTRREVERFTSVYQCAAEREQLQWQRWLRIRSEDICGSLVPRTGDLFDNNASDLGWRSLSAPLQRLESYAADAAIHCLADEKPATWYECSRSAAPRVRPCRRQSCARSECSCCCRRRSRDA